MLFKDLTRQIVSSKAFSKLEKYVMLIEEYNKVMNLTGFSGDRLWKEGIYESIISLKDCSIEGSLIDIGAGAGFPSVPYLISNPNIKLSIIEPLSKRIKFLNIVNLELDLGINFINSRAEEYKSLEKYDFITARAVAPLHVLAEISFDLGHIGSTFLWIKGPKVNEEIEESNKIFKKLNIVPKVFEVEDKYFDKNIFLIKYKKIINTPKGVPRNWAQIKK